MYLEIGFEGFICSLSCAYVCGYVHMRQEASNPLKLELEAVKVTPDGQWAPYLGLLQGKYVLLTAEPTFQPPGKSSIFIFWEGVEILWKN